VNEQTRISRARRRALADGDGTVLPMPTFRALDRGDDNTEAR